MTKEIDNFLEGVGWIGLLTLILIFGYLIGKYLFGLF